MSTDRQEIIEFLVDHYEHPRNRGALPDPDIHLTGGNPGCSDLVEIYAKVGADGVLEDVSFEGSGCTISMAAASYVTEMVQGMTLEQVDTLSTETLIDELGREVVMTRPTCATVALGTLKQGVHQLRMRRLAGEAYQRNGPDREAPAPTTDANGQSADTAAAPRATGTLSEPARPEDQADSTDQLGHGPEDECRTPGQLPSEASRPS